ncbi:MAG: hypothetical protein U0R50_04220 [Gaiellales bacterium]
MATDKQRRRRAKEKRHVYDLVEIDDEGNETVLKGSELKPEPAAKAAKNGKPAKRNARRAPASRREPPPPSWNRALKRGLIVAPLLVVVMLLLGGRGGAAVIALNAAFFALMFIPLSYFMDGMVYRSYQKRLTKTSR